MMWGVESHVTERFGAAGVAKEKISFARDTYTFNYPAPPMELVDAFRKYYGPTMNAFDAAEKNGRAADLVNELNTLFSSQNKSANGHTSIPATFLRVTVAL
jgi:hypothetical protein